MESNNSFHEMNSDISKIYQTNKQYLKALNMRPVTSLGGSNGALENIKGNLEQISFPTVQGVCKLQMSGGATSGVLTITINGVVMTMNSTSQTTVKDVLINIKLMSNYYNGTYSSTKTFTAVVIDDNLFISMNFEYVTGGSTASSLTITISNAGGNNTPEFIDSTGTISATQVNFVPANSTNDPVVIIG